MKRWAGGLTAALFMMATTAARADEDEGILVFVRGAAETVLEVDVGRGDWRQACDVPCGKRVDRHARYRLRGGDLLHSQSVSFGPEDEVVIEIEASPNASRKGRNVALVGLFVTAVSASLLVGGIHVMRGAHCLDCGDGDAGLFMAVTGFVGTAGGVVVGIVGLAMLGAAAAAPPTVQVTPKPAVVAPVVSFAW